MNTEKPSPRNIKAAGPVISIAWNDNHASRYAARDVRMACRCAACVDEWTHENLIRPDAVPMDVKAKAVEVVGSYALHIAWSDGHNTGIYTYDHLREICGCDSCKKPRSFDV